MNGLLRFLGRSLPANAFFGLPTAASQRELAGIQLLDGIFFTVENFRHLQMPEETQISAEMLRALSLPHR